MTAYLRAAVLAWLLLAVPAFAQRFESTAEGRTIRLEAVAEGVLRVRIATGGAFAEDASWAVPAAQRRPVAAREADGGIATGLFSARVSPGTLRLTVTDARGRVILDDASMPVRPDGEGFALRKAMTPTERFFALGDKTGPMDRRGGSFVNWNTDAYGFTSSTDPIYKSIPFTIGVGGAGGAYGLFLDNTHRSWFDFGRREEGVLAIGAAGGAIDYYVIVGPSVAEVVRRYTTLTGHAPLPPMWALGYQQSRYSYMTADEVRTIASRLRADRIPTDVIWLDIDYQDRNRPFTINRETFPDLAALAAELRGQGIRLVAITDLHIASAPREGYAPYDSGVAGDHFLQNADGTRYVGPVWPGPSVFPEFGLQATRDWWGGLYREFAEMGIGGFWNDMNEPAIFETPTKTMPPDVQHRIAGDGFAPRAATHAEMHNVYGMQNSRATYEGLQRLRPDLRPFVLTRATFAGGQRYAATWTGDNNSSWEHLRLTVSQLVNLGLSGHAYSGVDIGGFTGGASADLMTRFTQIGAFTPVFRNHVGKNTPRAEPWVDGPEHLTIRRRFIEERYRLMPFLYATAELNARTGDPIMRPVFYDYPDALAASCDGSMSFTLGGRLLIAPSPRPESPTAYAVCLPAGGWFDYWTGARVEPARVANDTQPAGSVLVTPAIATLPVYVRAGTILPRQPLVQSTAETPSGPLELHVYPGDDCRGELYADDGVSTARERGEYLRQAMTCTVTASGVRLDFAAREGRHQPWWREIAVTIHGWTGARARVSGVRGIDPAVTDGAARFTFPDAAEARRITLARR